MSTSKIRTLNKDVYEVHYFENEDQGNMLFDIARHVESNGLFVEGINIGLVDDGSNLHTAAVIVSS